jgi:2-dehydro-3-deoxygluconokinase
MTHKVVTFGESLLRLAPPGFERFLQSPQFSATFGGAEANVAVGLASFGMEAAYVTVLPKDNPIADAAIAELRRFGVDTSRIVRGKGRVGIYYMESGASQRAGRVVYDREHSAIALARPGDIPWETAFAGAGWFHTSGITPAISASAAHLALESMQKARAMGLTVSFDLNYRQKLWNWGKSASEVLTPMIRVSDVLIANEEHLQQIAGTNSVEALKTFGQLKAIAVTHREPNKWSATLNDRNETVSSREFDISQTVDRIGAGDAFAAGLIYGWTHLPSRKEALDFAAAASCLKHSIPGDFCRATVDEVRAILETQGRGWIQR